MTFLNARFKALVPYTPGEQPQISGLIKLNTNESPFPPAPGVEKAVAAASARLNLYPDPTEGKLKAKLAEELDVQENELFLGNGSDEILAFLFQGFTPQGILFPDLTYGFYPVFSGLYHVPRRIIPLRWDFSIALEDYDAGRETVLIANPNAPTGLVVKLPEIRRFLTAHPDRLLIIDEAYIDFGGQSAVPLIKEFSNLLVVGTFSKSRQLAGARLGYAAGSSSLIADLNRLKFSFNPYNINGMTQAAALAALADRRYFENCRNTVIETRATFTKALKRLGFEVLPSAANFVFAVYPGHSGKLLAEALRTKKIIVRRFDLPRIENYLRITIGTPEQMQLVINALTDILMRKEPA